MASRYRVHALQRNDNEQVEIRCCYVREVAQKVRCGERRWHHTVSCYGGTRRCGARYGKT